jgi:hypothetical protein
MDLRSKHLEKKSFPIRLSSANTKEFKNNTNTIFKVKLPQKYQLSRDWRIALTSISHPNVYSTFLEDEKTRFILFRETTEVNPKIVKIIIPNMQKIYTVDELVKCIDLQMKSAKIGFAELVDNKCKLNLKKDFFASFSNYLLSILGYAGKIDESTRFTELKFKAETNGQFSFHFIKTIISLIPPRTPIGGSKRIFVFINMPVGGKAYVDKIYKSTPYLEQMFLEKYEDGSNMSKRDLERCGIMFPAGPRYQMLPYELRENFDKWSPSGPDLFDIVHERYMAEQKKLREKKS